MRESDLYAPIKAHLLRQGYDVKGEVGACDVMALRGNEEPVVVELKLTFSLALVMQGVARQTMFEQVYLAVPVSGEKGWKLRYRDIIRLCRRLGLGLLTVRASDNFVEAHADPTPYVPRKSKKKAQKLVREFERLRGDPNAGGATRHGIVTGYRQDALHCAAYLAEHGPSKGADVARAVKVPKATRLMADNHYGWFERESRGIYALTPMGSDGLKHWAESW